MNPNLRFGGMSNYPPGVSEAMIDEQYTTEDLDDEEYPMETEIIIRRDDCPTFEFVWLLDSRTINKRSLLPLGPDIEPITVSSTGPVTFDTVLARVQQWIAEMETR